MCLPRVHKERGRYESEGNKDSGGGKVGGACLTLMADEQAPPVVHRRHLHQIVTLVREKMVNNGDNDGDNSVRIVLQQCSNSVTTV
jgi:hypothetical protein